MDENRKESYPSFEELFAKVKIPLAIFIGGVILVGIGSLMYKGEVFGEKDKVEILSSLPSITSIQSKEIVVEIAGAVEKPGVYKLNSDSRIEDLLIISGGFSAKADRGWIEKYINRAAKLIDGQKVYIAAEGEQLVASSAKNSDSIKVGQGVLGVESGGLVNINSASLSELDKLPGIGQVYGQSIIDHRPYSNLDELVTRGAIKQSVFEKIKDKVTLY